MRISIQTLRKNSACDLVTRIRDVSAHLGRKPWVTEEIPVSMWWSLPSTSLDDMFWSLRCFPEGKIVGVRASCLAARRTLDMTHEEDRAACLAAIEAAEAYAEDPTDAAAAAAAADAYAHAAAAYIRVAARAVTHADHIAARDATYAAVSAAAACAANAVDYAVDDAVYGATCAADAARAAARAAAYAAAHIGVDAADADASERDNQRKDLIALVSNPIERECARETETETEIQP